MKRIAVALLAGALFGAGLTVSGMVDPGRVKAFLDIAGAWDPTLAFVMAGALLPMMLAWTIYRRLEAPLVDAHFDLPGTALIDRKLAAGSILFGVGWGIAGLCPGPAVAGLALVPAEAAIFVTAMLAGMIAERLFQRLAR